jgi:hypothetical protein
MKVILFGAGDFCRRHIQYVDNNVEILAICDNDINLRGGGIDTVIVSYRRRKF